MTNTSKRLMIFAVMMGLMLSLASAAHSAPIDAGPQEAPKLLSDDMGALDKLAEPDIAGLAEAAQTTPEAGDSVDDALGTAGEVVEDVRAGNWRHAIAGFLVLVMLGLGKARDSTDWFSGDRAGALLVIGLGIGGGLVTTLYASGPIDWQLFLGSTGVITSAVGIYTLAKKLIWPSDKSQK